MQDAGILRRHVPSWGMGSSYHGAEFTTGKPDSNQMALLPSCLMTSPRSRQSCGLAAIMTNNISHIWIALWLSCHCGLWHHQNGNIYKLPGTTEPPTQWYDHCTSRIPCIQVLNDMSQSSSVNSFYSLVAPPWIFHGVIEITDSEEMPTWALLPWYKGHVVLCQNKEVMWDM